MTSHRTVRAEAREALAPVLHTDGTARGTQYRDFARVYPGETATITVYYWYP